MGRSTIITIEGESKSIKAWSMDPRCGVTDAAIRQRLERGWTGKAAVLTPRTRPPGRPPGKVEAFGERKSIASWVRDERCRVRKAQLHNRLNGRWPPELAITWTGPQWMANVFNVACQRLSPDRRDELIRTILEIMG